MEKNELPTGVTKDQVNAWKEKYGEKNIHLAELYASEEAELKPVIVRTPDRVTHHEFEKFADTQPLKAKTILIKACVLTALDEVLADDVLFLSAFAAVANLLPRGAATLKNL